MPAGDVWMDPALSHTLRTVLMARHVCLRIS